MSTGPVPIQFIIPEFESMIRLSQDVLTEIETEVTPQTSFICDVNMPVSLFRDTFLFSTDDVSEWETLTNAEKTMFFVNRTLDSNASTDSWWKQYSMVSSDVGMFNISTAPVSDNRLSVSSYTTKGSVNVTEIYCAWYMSRILNGIKDAQVLVNNALSIQSNINTLFKDQVFNTSIDSILWHYNLWGGNGSTYAQLRGLPLDDTIKRNSSYAQLMHPPDNSLIYGVPFVTNNTSETQTLPQRLFEQLAYSDLERLRTLSYGQYITPSDVYSLSNTSSRIPPEVLGSDLNHPLTNVYRFPFIENDTLVFKLSVKVKHDNTLTIFNNAGSGNITTTIQTLNSGFNAGVDEDLDFISYLVRIKLV